MFLNKGKECFLKDFTIKFCIHYPFKNANFGCSFSAYSGPYVYLSWVFWARFWVCLLSILPVAVSLVRFHLNCGLVIPNHIFEGAMKVRRASDFLF